MNIRKLRPNKQKFRKTKLRIAFKQTAADLRNLKQVQSMETNKCEHVTSIRIGTMHARSIKNKGEFILESINDLKLDTTVVTEKWLQDTDEDASWIEYSEFHSDEDQISAIKTVNKRGGGLVLICSSKHKAEALPILNMTALRVHYGTLN